MFPLSCPSPFIFIFCIFPDVPPDISMCSTILNDTEAGRTINSVDETALDGSLKEREMLEESECFVLIAFVCNLSNRRQYIYIVNCLLFLV